MSLLTQIIRRETDRQEATRFALSFETYQLFKRQNLLKHCLPQEECTCGPLDDVTRSLLKQYKADDMMNIRTPEYKKTKELFLTCLLARILRSDNKSEIALCLPERDRGIDIYIRLIYHTKKLIQLLPIQITEMPERYTHTMESDDSLAQALFDFVKSKKLAHYPKSHACLLIWLEPDDDRRLNLVHCRDLFNAESVMPFDQIITFGKMPGDKYKFGVASVYTNDDKNFTFVYDYSSDSFETN